MSSETLNEPSSRPSTSASIQTVPAATTSLAARSCDIHENIQSATSTSYASNVSLPYKTGINPHVYSFANSISQPVYSNLRLSASVPSVASNLNLNSSRTRF